MPRLPRSHEILACIAVATVLAIFTVNFAMAQTRPREGFATASLGIQTAAGTSRFSIEIARTPEQQQFGLMFRNKLPADAGMLFVYDRPMRLSMWMKNTLIPLDMLFIGADGRIVDIAERRIPLSVEPIYSSVPALAVLELNGGTVERLGIKRGDRVLHDAFSSS